MSETNKESLTADVKIIFKNTEGLKKELTITVDKMLDSTKDDLYELLEETKPCKSASCNNESQNFCDCGSSFEDYIIYSVEFTDQQTKVLQSEITQIKEQLAKTTEVMQKHIDEQDALIFEVKEQNKQLAEAIQFALNNKDLWLIYKDCCAPEHETEAIAVQNMHNKFIEALTNYQKQTKD